MKEVTTFERAFALAEPVTGWLTRAQAQRLYSLARDAAPGGCIVEIGSYQGKSTIVIAAAKPSGMWFLAVDPYLDCRWGRGDENLEAFRTNIERAGLTGEIELFKGFSADAAAGWSKPISFVYVDGAHDYANALFDIRVWRPHVVDGGYMAVHDVFSSVGVTRAVFRDLFASREFEFVSSDGTLAVFRRGRFGPATRIASALRMLARLGYFARNLVVKVGLRMDWKWLQRIMGHNSPYMPY